MFLPPTLPALGDKDQSIDPRRHYFFNFVFITNWKIINKGRYRIALEMIRSLSTDAISSHVEVTTSEISTHWMEQCHAKGKVERKQIRSSDFTLSRLWSTVDYHFRFENASRDSSSSTTNANDFDWIARTSSASFPPFSRSRLRS